jgi:hypothetical protein
VLPDQGYRTSQKAVIMSLSNSGVVISWVKPKKFEVHAPVSAVTCQPLTALATQPRYSRLYRIGMNNFSVKHLSMRVHNKIQVTDMPLMTVICIYSRSRFVSK